MTGAHHHGESDWDDLDLLTVDLALERLDEEIATLRAALAEPAPAGADRAAAEARLAALVATRERMSTRPPAR